MIWIWNKIIVSLQTQKQEQPKLLGQAPPTMRRKKRESLKQDSMQEERRNYSAPPAAWVGQVTTQHPYGELIVTNAILVLPALKPKETIA